MFKSWLIISVSEFYPFVQVADITTQKRMNIYFFCLFSCGFFSLMIKETDESKQNNFKSAKTFNGWHRIK